MAETLINVRVARKVPLAQDICAFDLVAADGGALPPFEAGAHIDVHLDAAAGGWVRPYSLCSPPLERHRWQIAALREPASRGGSVAMHERVSVGSLLAVSVPRHHFALAARAGHSLLLAGGIGITPLLAMAEQLWAQGADFELHHCTRTLARTPFRERVAAAPWAGRVHGHLDDGPPAQRLDLDALLATPAPETHLYVCGPQGFMDAVLGRARPGLARVPAALGSLPRRSGAAGQRPAFRAAAGAQRPHDHGRCRADRGTRAGSRRRLRAYVLRAGRVRHLPDACAGGHARAP